MLYDRLARTERAGDRRNTAFGDGEQGVDDPLTGDQRFIRGELLLVGPPDADRPLDRKSVV